MASKGIALPDGSTSQLALTAYLLAVDDRLEKAVTMLGHIERYVEGDGKEIVDQTISVAVELVRQAQHQLADVRGDQRP